MLILNYRKIHTLLLLILVTLVSCTKIDGDGSAEVIVGLQSDKDVVAKSGASENIDLGMDINQYVVNIYKDDQPYAGWDTYADLPENKKVRLNMGTYLISAYWGENRAAAFDSPYYYGEREFTLSKNAEVVPVDLVCSLANVKLDIKFTDLFKDITLRDFVSYQVDIYTDHTSSPLQFEASETRTAYLREGRIMLRLILTKADGMEYDYGFDYIEGVKAKDSYTVTLDYSHSQQGAFNIKINESTRDFKDEITVSLDDLVKREPLIKLSFDPIHEFIAKEPAKDDILLAYFNCDSKIDDIVLKSSNDYFTSNGLPVEISFKDLITNSVLAEKMKSIGFEWDNSIIGARNGIIRFSAVTKDMDTPINAPWDYGFEFIAKDTKNRTYSKAFTFRAMPPVFSMPEVIDGGVWSGQSTLSEMSREDFPYETYDKSKFSYEISADGNSWNTVGFENGELLAKNLTPNTTYYVRSKYRHFTSAARTFTTENSAQVENSNMETWWNVAVNGGTNWLNWPTNEWFATNNGNRNPYWSSKNPQTTSQRSGTVTNYTSNSGTRNTTDKRSGSYAAEIVTVGWGTGSTLTASGKKSDAKNVTTGRLFIGSSAADGSVNMGREFTSRPTALSFYYKYYPINKNQFIAEIVIQNRDNGIVDIGKGYLQSGTSVGSYTNAKVNVTYDPAYTHLKATHMYIHFASRHYDWREMGDVNIINGSDGWYQVFRKHKYEGSRLLVDDISLIYEK